MHEDLVAIDLFCDLWIHHRADHKRADRFVGVVMPQELAPANARRGA
jgi:hypothetical protein